MKKLTAIIAAIILTASGASAQQLAKGQTGQAEGEHFRIGVGVDGNFSSGNLRLTFRPTGNFAFELFGGTSFDINRVDAGPGLVSRDGVDYQAGLTLLYHPVPAPISPYIGVEGAFQYDKEAGVFAEGVDPDPVKSIRGGLVLGVEYLVHPYISVGVKNNFDLTFDLEREFPSERLKMHFDTRTMLTGRFYIR